MQMYIVISRDNPDNDVEIISVSPTDGMVLVRADDLGTEQPESDTEKEDFLAFILEGPHIVQLFPKREWAQEIADDITQHGTEAVVVKVDIKL